MESRDTCIFYRSIFEAIEMLNSDQEKAVIYNAIFNYSLNFIEPELSGTCAMIWKLIEPVLQKGNTNYINGSKPKEKAKTKRNRSDLEAKPKRIVSEHEAYKDKDKDKDEYKDKEKDVSNYKKWDIQDFKKSITENKKAYQDLMLTKFFNYWSEKDDKGKMKFQLQKTWETSKRLATWSANNFTPVAQDNHSYSRASRTRINDL